MKTWWLVLVITVTFSGCGYKPTSTYAKQVLGESVYVVMKIHNQDPENAVLVKDAVIKTLRSRMHISNRKDANSTLKLSLGGLSFSAMQYNSDGYIVMYRTRLSLNAQHIKAGVSNNYSAVGTYDFNVPPNAIISDAERFSAIANSASKAVDILVAKMAVKGLQANDNQ